jgi:hypothetical protein
MLAPSANHHTPATVHVRPAHRPDGLWTFDDLLVFLNELDPEWQVPGRSWSTHDRGEDIFKFTAVKKSSVLHFHVPLRGGAGISVTTNERSLGDEWEVCDIRVGRKVLGTCRTLDETSHRWTTDAFKRSEIPVDAKREDLGPCFAWFVNRYRYAEHRLSEQRSAFVGRLCGLLSAPAAHEEADARAAFCTEGDLTFVLEDQEPGDRLEEWRDGGKTYLITGGV